MVRDYQGSVLLHSRRSYTQVHSLANAKFLSWEWALGSMLHQLIIIVLRMCSSAYEMVRALNKPKEWPAVLGHITELLRFTKDRPNWFVLMEPLQCNKGASKIAESVLTGSRCQSYVARGFPQWLKLLFAEERCNT